MVHSHSHTRDSGDRIITYNYYIIITYLTCEMPHLFLWQCNHYFWGIGNAVTRLRYAAYWHALFTVDTLSLSVNLTSSTCHSCWRVDLLELHVTLMVSQLSYHVGVAWRTYWLVHLLELGTRARTHTHLFAEAGRLAGYRSFLGPHRSIPWTAEQRESGWLICKHALPHIVSDCQVRIPVDTPAIAFEIFRGFPQFHQSNAAILRRFDSHRFFLYPNYLPPTLCNAVYRQHRKITTWKTFNRKCGLVTGEIR